MRKSLILKSTPPEWNIRILTMDMFYDYCREGGIYVYEKRHVKQRGLHMFYDGHPRLFISKELRGYNRHFVAYHELAHFWLHPPGIRYFTGMRDVTEFEADAVATCALIPITVLTHYLPAEIAEEYGYPMERIKFRQVLWEYWRL